MTGGAYYLTVANLTGTNSASAPRIYRGVNLDGSFTGRGTLINNSNFRGVAFADGVYVAIGSNHIYSSSDGLTWTRRAEALTPSILNKIGWADGVFVVVGNAGSILTSANGTDWVAVISPTANELNRLYHGDGAWFASGPSKTLVSSGPALNLETLALVSPPVPTVVQAGGNTAFNAVFSGNPAPTVEWWFTAPGFSGVLTDGVTPEGMIVSGATTGVYTNHAFRHLGRMDGEPTPISPPSGPTQWLFQVPPAESKFLAANFSIISLTAASFPEWNVKYYVFKTKFRHTALLSRNSRGICGHFTILRRYLFDW